MRSIVYTVILSFVAMAFIACGSKKVVDQVKEDDNVIRVSLEQFNTTGMKLGEPGIRIFYDEVRASGFTIPSPNGVASVNSLISGKVSGLSHTVGSYIPRGKVIFTVGGNEVVSLQQDYIQSCSDHDFKKKELDRVTKLVKEEISAEKTLFEAQNAYKLALSKKNSVGALLDMLNLDHEKVEAGKISSFVEVIAPISGYITNIAIVNGQYIQPGYEAVKMVDTQKLKLKLNVFKSDINSFRPGQKVVFFDPDHKQKEYSATIELVGKEVDSETKTISCIASIDGVEQAGLINGLFVESRIILREWEALSLPADAVFSSGEKQYVFVKTGEENGEILFTRVDVETGPTINGYSELVNTGLSNILLEGGYYLATGE
ncbi:MAG: efflux RND transporter periplasmic adaptor subunit [Prolixibacteraceae bacterium]|nr:efflux RND transporter periplasmic adaptor subunit [Prolixibacteraceae bacterium]